MARTTRQQPAANQTPPSGGNRQTRRGSAPEESQPGMNMVRPQGRAGIAFGPYSTPQNPR